MHRFGRSDGRWGDQWGAGFLLAVVLLLVGAYYAGTWLSGVLGPDEVAPAENPDVTPFEYDTVTDADLGGMPTPAPVSTAEYPKPLTVYFLQAHALRSPDAADQEARRLEEMGVPAAVAHEGEWYKVIVGAYGSKDAADAAQATAETATNLSLYANRVNIAGQPALSPTLAEAQEPYQQGVAALNSFVHTAADWWDRYVTSGYPDTADVVTRQAQGLQAAAQALEPYAADPAVSELLRVSDLALQTSQHIGGLAANPQPTGDGYQAAMESYVSLVDAYRSWADTGS